METLIQATYSSINLAWVLKKPTQMHSKEPIIANLELAPIQTPYVIRLKDFLSLGIIIWKNLMMLIVPQEKLFFDQDIL